MRPHDIAVLLKIVISGNDWQNKYLAEALSISQSEISYSLHRSSVAGLIDPTKRKVMRQTLLEFIQFGLPYVFPAERGGIARGVPTAYSAPIMKGAIVSNDQLVWPYANGSARGETILPIYPNAIQAALNDPELYDLLALIDVMRIGRVREKEIAIGFLKERFKNTHAERA